MEDGVGQLKVLDVDVDNDMFSTERGMRTLKKYMLDGKLQDKLKIIIKAMTRKKREHFIQNMPRVTRCNNKEFKH